MREGRRTRGWRRARHARRFRKFQTSRVSGSRVVPRSNLYLVYKQTPLPHSLSSMQALANLQRLARTKITPHATPRHAQTRNAGGANSGHTGYGTGPYRGFVFPEPPQWQTALGHVMLTSTFLWFFWRMKWDGGHLVVSQQSTKHPHPPTHLPRAGAARPRAARARARTQYPPRFLTDNTRASIRRRATLDRGRTTSTTITTIIMTIRGRTMTKRATESSAGLLRARRGTGSDTLAVDRSFK